MFSIKRLFKTLIKVIILLFSFMLILLVIVGLLSENFGFDYVNGEEIIKSSHLLTGVLGSFVFVTIINTLLSRFIVNKKSLNSDLNDGSRRWRNRSDHDYIDDMENDFIDNTPADFIDDLPRSEKLNKFGSLNKKMSRKKKHFTD